DIYNINGQMVRHLYALPVFGGRYKDMVWDGRNDRGQKVANGIYFIRVRAGSEENVKKVVVLR
ncbi:MAG TPA: FlgD immunoglobulin-like domain containing protein, partial [Candidatus Krumholzibacterium sp.]|nr:FlgD immunoglobulin-like domain containing protein [Candidatus Krumholzibacterium sp.]